MEDKKYYVPELEEFCVGFEFEVLKNKTWENISLSDWANCEGTDANYECLNDISHGIENGKIRVKYLCREDIESLGWEKKEYTSMGRRQYSFGKEYDLSVNYLEVGGNVRIFWNRPNDRLVIFDGKLKNKTELKKLMKMLGIL